MHFHGGEGEEKKNKTLQMNAETAENYRIFIDTSQSTHKKMWAEVLAQSCTLERSI